MVTIDDLGILRDVSYDGATLVVTITPTYSGCPAIGAIRADIDAALRGAGFDDVDVRTALHPAWTTDWVSAEGRRKLHEHGISPPTHGATATTGPVPLTLSLPTRLLTCPRCGSSDTRETSHFGSTACKSLHRCRSCGEPFEHVKEL
ncbi:phenylacetate-CoA oxygenase subunit PaaJ [Solicola gregarius]|uniref:Phenylacetate-CoA oxygenase subunit PaaJ n=2 Tax=Solicola gregarius TaxID=2908642 RepID=A0AA46YPP5_9ACTN|nr:phenylacetate-CoA oxygenase subunit PaaJ [Solicola gregarius]